eukprot:TRINITY_DN2473_c0_g1_i5.p1 TRINITY_DN2473_c0_g1~~TRINITY_DN2473_c0_g1_i5.p1  ORF type:complete len:220 (-),score=52.84 TRINITY_DN2473_c0_g1_i5:601-1260(-)
MAYAALGNQVCIFGGAEPVGPRSFDYLNDIWCTFDFITWDQKQANAPFLGREGAEALLLPGVPVFWLSGGAQSCHVFDEVYSIDFDVLNITAADPPTLPLPERTDFAWSMANDNEFCIYGGRTGDYPGCESLNDIACANLTVFGIDFERDVEGELELSCDANGLHLCLNYTGNFTLDYWSGLAGPFEIGNGFEEECFNTTVSKNRVLIILRDNGVCLIV